MRNALTLMMLLVGCDAAAVAPVSSAPVTAHINDPAWLTDCAAALGAAGVAAAWVGSPEDAAIRVRVFPHSSDCPNDSTGAPAAAFSCPGGPISVWPKCGHAAAEIARHVRLRMADAPSGERVDACSRDLDF
jgi:hypothetical protein